MSVVLASFWGILRRVSWNGQAKVHKLKSLWPKMSHLGPHSPTRKTRPTKFTWAGGILNLGQESPSIACHHCMPLSRAGHTLRTMASPIYDRKVGFPDFAVFDCRAYLGVLVLVPPQPLQTRNHHTDTTRTDSKEHLKYVALIQSRLPPLL